MGVRGNLTAVAGVDHVLPWQSDTYEAMWSKTRDLQLRALLGAGLDGVLGRGLISGGLQAVSGLDLEVAAGTELFYAGLVFDVPTDLLVPLTDGGASLLTNHVWALVEKTEADYGGANREAVDTYALTVEVVTGSTDPPLDPAGGDWIKLGEADTQSGAVVGAVRTLPGQTLGRTRLNAHQTATTLDHPDGSVTLAKLAADAKAVISGSPGLTATAEVSNARQVTVQAKDQANVNVAGRRVVRVWLSDSSFGLETPTAPDGGVTITLGDTVHQVTANKQWVLITDANGQVRLTITHSAAHTWHVMAEQAGLVSALELAFT